MAKQAKPKTKRTQVKDMAVAQQELTVEEAHKVKGGIGLLLPAVQKIKDAPSKPTASTDGTTQHFFTVKIKGEN
jgi:hypothetical protein